MKAKVVTAVPATVAVHEQQLQPRSARIASICEGEEGGHCWCRVKVVLRKLAPFCVSFVKLKKRNKKNSFVPIFNFSPSPANCPHGWRWTPFFRGHRDSCDPRSCTGFPVCPLSMWSVPVPVHVVRVEGRMFDYGGQIDARLAGSHARYVDGGGVLDKRRCSQWCKECRGEADDSIEVTSSWTDITGLVYINPFPLALTVQTRCSSPYM